jgi:hypothetical protein
MAIQLTIGKVTNIKRVAKAVQEDKRVVYPPGTMLRYIGESQCVTVIGGSLFEDGLLVTFTGVGRLIGTKDFQGLHYRELLKCDIVPLCILDDGGVFLTFPNHPT